MADLNELQSSQSVKLAGATAPGVESNYAQVNNLQQLYSYEAPLQQGTDTTITLSTTAVEAKVGASALTNRMFVTLQALGSNVRFGYTTTCPFILFPNQLVIIPASEISKVYVKSTTGTPQIVVGES